MFFYQLLIGLFHVYEVKPFCCLCIGTLRTDEAITEPTIAFLIREVYVATGPIMLQQTGDRADGKNYFEGRTHPMGRRYIAPSKRGHFERLKPLLERLLSFCGQSVIEFEPIC